MTENTKNTNHFEMLYRKYLNDDISVEEFHEMLKWADNEKIKEIIDHPIRENWKEIIEQYPISETQLLVPDKRKKVWNIIGWSVAASIMLLVATTQWMWNREIVWEEYSTGNGETRLIHLSDESKVILNANSTIRWNPDWETEGQRKIDLVGEAFFDITHVDKIPLTVQSSHAMIEVLGTSFNVREDALGTDIYLHEGKIKLDLSGVEGDSSQMVMKSGDWVVKELKSPKVKVQSDVSKRDAASWTEGELRFRDQSLGDILIQLERIYGKHFLVEDSTMLSMVMDLGVPYANWEVMSSVLELSLGVEIEESEEIVKLKNK
ncbi:FecR family protein [Membranihabitans marinus]|uniref:FecR family protein n=1 Tax=Membranihabitans marinus TaxID=1227546 RepID=UPI001F2946E0|nr:FecR domain-containing protein [Membranihabitans marinus]